MHPILFEIPGLGWPVRSFGVMVAIGFLVGSHIFTRLGARYGDDPKNDPARYSNITVWIVVGVMIGARAMYVIVQILMNTDDGKHFKADPLSILRIWEGGLVMYGGMIGAIGFGMWAAKRMNVRAVHALDMGLVGGFVGQAIGRIGCFLVGDDYGKIVPERFQNLPFPLTVRVPNPLPKESLFGADNAGQLLWATQPMMLMKALLIAFIGWQILKRRRYAGQVSLWILLMYAILRSLVETLRGDGVRGVWFDGTVSTSQLVSLVIAIFAAALLFKNRHTQNPLPDSKKLGG